MNKPANPYMPDHQRVADILSPVSHPSVADLTKLARDYIHMHSLARKVLNVVDLEPGQLFEVNTVIDGVPRVILPDFCRLHPTARLNEYETYEEATLRAAREMCAVENKMAIGLIRSSCQSRCMPEVTFDLSIPLNAFNYARYAVEERRFAVENILISKHDVQFLMDTMGNYFDVQRLPHFIRLGHVGRLLGADVWTSAADIPDAVEPGTIYALAGPMYLGTVGIQHFHVEPGTIYDEKVHRTCTVSECFAGALPGQNKCASARLQRPDQSDASATRRV